MAKTVPEKNTIIIHSIIATISIAFWFVPNVAPDIIYGKYGPILFGFLCSFVATTKNRNPIVWFAAGLWFVLAALIVSILVPKIFYKICPLCKEGIAKDAIVCPHCQRDISKQEIAAN